MKNLIEKTTTKQHRLLASFNINWSRPINNIYQWGTRERSSINCIWRKYSNT